MAIDYAQRIDRETWAFIERTNSFYPPDAVDLSIAQQREVYDRMCRAFHAGHPDGVMAVDAAIPAAGFSIPIRRYHLGGTEPAVQVIYFHGGGFILGGLDSHDDVCADLCARTGFEVLSVDYRLSPEHRHPTAFEDALIAFRFAQSEGRPVLLCGDSAGGNLAAAVVHAVRGEPNAPRGQVLIYPGLGGDQEQGSYLAHADAPMLTVRDLDFYRDIRSGGKDHSNDPTFAPLRDTRFENLPPTVIITAECDPLSSDGESYRDRILSAGGKALWIEEGGLVHGYLRARHSVKRAADSFTRIVEALQALANGRLPAF